ncbi:MAG: DNA polymerase II large subunit [Candidatus Thermoplasmatota archaeon]|nr:DNA polymerase II large subunit [Candidatus Thermoplasmatota archaeon]
MSEGPAVSPEMDCYFTSLRERANTCAEIASKARTKGYDPTDTVEIPFADDLAGRVENLVGPPGIAERIRELGKDMGRERLLLQISQEVAQAMLESGEDKQKALDQATRTGLAILTEGVLVAPLEGIAEVKIGTNPDSSTYADIYFAGPIRAAGGTAQAVSVLIADQVRKKLGIGEFKVTEQEIARYIEEFQLYRNLQYRPTNEEIENVVRYCPVCINGEGTEKVEVQGNRDLKRVQTNQVRSGVCLVIAEGVLLKAKKILKITKSLEIKGWDFLEKLKGKNKEAPKQEEGEEKGNVCREEEILEKLISMKDIQDDVGDYLSEVDEEGNYLEFSFDDDGQEEGVVHLTDEGLAPTAEVAAKYIKDLIAGRPVFSHPSRPGGFRLRYGRGRTCGLASIGINPYTLFLTEEFLATGTQVKIERPGKAGAVTPVDSIDGPTVLLNNGDLVYVNSMSTARSVKGRIQSITDLGEMLIPFGEFAENNHSLVQGSYTEDWWKWEAQCSLFMRENGLKEHPFAESFGLDKRSEEIKKEAMEPLAQAKCSPEVEQLSDEMLGKLVKKCEEDAERNVSDYLKEAALRSENIEKEVSRYDISGHIPKNGSEAFKVSRELGIPLHPTWTLMWHDIDISELNRLRNHVMEKGQYQEDEGLLLHNDDGIKEVLIKLSCPHEQKQNGYLITQQACTLLRCLGIGDDLRSIKVPKGFSKANNVMKAVNLLAGIKVMERAPTRIGARMGRPEKADIRQMKPPVHGLYPVGFIGGQQRLVKKTFSGPVEANTIPRLCPDCRNISPYSTCPNCNTKTMRQSSNENQEGMMLNTREDAERAARRLHYPSIDSLPAMKGVKGLISREKIPERIEKGMLRAKHEVFVFRDGTIRYDMTDITMTHFKPSEIGASLDKLREMGYHRDIHGNDLDSPDQILELKVQDIVINEKAGDYLIKVAKFIDDELELIYGGNRYYNATSKEDLIGELAIGLAPHTSAGVLCRIAGYTQALGCMGHPFYHASKRRNCDGDEDAIMLLMDGLLNFSRKFLPERRGGQMDAPLVLSMRLDPSEIDKEAHNVDVRSRYPLDFHLATTRNEKINEYWMKRMDTVRSRLGTPLQFEGFGFSQDTSDLNFSPRISAYKTIGVTEEKIKSQLDLARRIRAVDEDDVAERVLTTHLLPDLIGNLRSFAQQSFRCTKCGTKYRRITLTGKCSKWLLTPHPHRCNNKLILTVSEGSVKKYLGIAQRISQEYKVSNYLKQRIDIMSRSIESMFPSRFKETKLESFM